MPNQASADPPTWRFPLCRQPCHCWAPLTGPLASPKLKLTSSGGKMVGEMVVVRDSGDPTSPQASGPFRLQPPSLAGAGQSQSDISLDTPHIHLDL